VIRISDRELVRGRVVDVTQSLCGRGGRAANCAGAELSRLIESARENRLDLRCRVGPARVIEDNASALHVGAASPGPEDRALRARAREHESAALRGGRAGVSVIAAEDLRAGAALGDADRPRAILDHATKARRADRVNAQHGAAGDAAGDESATRADVPEASRG